MSYEILYDRRFIRTTRGIVPMILSGSNNCYDIKYDGRGRSYEVRERHWWAYIPRGLGTKDLPENELLKAFEELFYGTDGCREVFKSKGRWLTVRQHRKWFQNGCKDARSLEEYLRCNPCASLLGFVRVYPKQEGAKETEALRKYLHTTQELEDFLDSADQFIKQAAKEQPCECYLSLDFTTDQPLKVFPKCPDGVLVKNGKCFLKEYVPGKRLSFTGDPMEAIVFESPEAAILQIGNHWHDLSFVSAKTAQRPKDLILQVADGLFEEKYVCSFRRGHIDFTSNVEHAKHYADKAGAKRAMQQVFQRVNKRFLGAIRLYDINEDKEIITVSREAVETTV